MIGGTDRNHALLGRPRRVRAGPLATAWRNQNVPGSRLRKSCPEVPVL